MTTNIFGPGHYGTTNETASRPTPVATLKAFDTWFQQCLADGSGGTNIDEMFLNFLLASLRQFVRTAGATEGELLETMIAEASARYASGAVYGATSTGTSTAYVVAATGLFHPPESYFDGMEVEFTPHADCGASPTIEAYGLAAKGAFDPTGVALTAGILKAGRRVSFRYSTTANSGAGGLVLSPWAMPASSALIVPTQLVYTATGAITPLVIPSGVYAIEFELWGAGGGGGYAAVSSGAGGAAGGAMIAHRVAVKPGDTVTGSVGAGGAVGTAGVDGTAGGNTTLTVNGNTWTAGGGPGGKTATNGQAQVSVAGGVPTGATALRSRNGSTGRGAVIGYDGSGKLYYGGDGGVAANGGPVAAAGTTGGLAGNAPGGGGGGSASNGSLGTPGAGARGEIVIRYWVQ